MKKKDRLLTINRICDDFESKLRVGAEVNTDEVLQGAIADFNELPIAELLPELIELQIVYSNDRRITADALKSKYPEYKTRIESALQQASLEDEPWDAHEDGRAADEFLRPEIQRSLAEIGDRFTDLEHFASGGLGNVYVGFDKAVSRRVAVKLLKPELISDPRAKSRFLNEGAITGMLEHPGIVPIYDSGVTEDGQPYYAMRLLGGETLKEAVSRLHAKGTDDFEDRQRSLLRRLAQVCDAISFAHNCDIIHRDLKPANILLGEYGESVVIDWGLARYHGDDFQDLEDLAKPLTAVANELQGKVEHATEFGSVLGTLEYMSPEQASGDPELVGKPTDVFALGAVLYSILTGEAPLEGDSSSTMAERIEKAKKGMFPNARQTNPRVPKALDAICSRAMHVRPARRYETPLEFKADIENWLSDQPLVALPDQWVDKVARFVRKHRRWALASALTLIAITVGSILAASIINRQGATLAKQKVNLEQQAELQAQTEKVKDEQLNALLFTTTWNEMGRNNYDSAWQTLSGVPSSSLGWIGGHLANVISAGDAKYTMHGHAHWVSSVDVSPKGDLVVSGGADRAVYLWPAKRNETPGDHAWKKRQIFDSTVRAVCFSNSQDQIAVAQSKSISIFDGGLNKLQRTVGPWKAPVSAMRWLPNADTPLLVVAVGEKAGESRLILVDASSDDSHESIINYPHEISSLAFDRKGTLLVTGCSDGNVRIWKTGKQNPEKGSSVPAELESTFPAHPNGVTTVDVSDDGRMIATAGFDGTACLWDTESNELVAHLKGHSSKVTAIDISPKGNRVVTASSDQAIIVWDSDGNVVERRRGHTGPVHSVKFSPDGKSVVSAGEDQTVRKWDLLYDLASLEKQFENSDVIWSADFSPTKALVAAVGSSGDVLLIDTTTGMLTRKISTSKELLTAEWLTDGRLFVAGRKSGIKVWDGLEGDTEESQFKIDSVDDSTIIWDITSSPDEKEISFVGSEGVIRILDATSLKEVASWKAHPAPISCVEYSKDGKYMVTGSDDNALAVWERATHKLVHRFEGHTHAVWRAVFSPLNNGLIASSAVDGSIILWDLNLQQRVPVTIEGHRDDVAGLQFTVDGKRLVSASDDGSVRFWDVETGVEQFVFHKQAAQAMIDVAFSNDGKSMVVTGIGRVDIRHAAFDFSIPYRLSDSIADADRAFAILMDEQLPEEELLKVLDLSRKVATTFPSFRSLGLMGAAQVRLGRYTEAVKSLTEARRVEKATYGHGDVQPYIEGYLALAHAGCGNLEQARHWRDVYNQTAHYWTEDRLIESLDELIQESIDSLAEENGKANLPGQR